LLLFQVLILKQYANNCITLVVVSIIILGLKMQQRLRNSLWFWTLLISVYVLSGCWADSVELKETPVKQGPRAALEDEKGEDNGDGGGTDGEVKKETSPLVISVEKLRTEKGKACFLLFDAPVPFTYGFDAKAIDSGCVAIDKIPVVAANLNLEVGKKYMIFIFHDEDTKFSEVNGKLDYINMKIPSEGMGLSKNPQADRPTYADAEFTHSADVGKMLINMRYIF
jgi:uncharacterized protein (DUF2141 family)